MKDEDAEMLEFLLGAVTYLGVLAILTLGTLFVVMVVQYLAK